VLQNLNLDNTSKFDCAMWSIWKQRNDIVWKERITRTAVRERGISLLTGWRNFSYRKFKVYYGCFILENT
jgi:hypothetical protein